MEILSKKTEIDFMGMRFLWLAVSLSLIAASFFLWFSTGDEKFGVDFRGGTEIVSSFKGETSVAQVRAAFEKAGFSEVIVQRFESDKSDREFSIRLPQDESTAEGKEKVASTLLSVNPAGYTIIKQDFVGPVIGEQIRRDGITALLYALVAMLLYVAFRFEWRFGVGAIVALFHDVIITTGVCILTGRQLSAGILAALLTIVGYSINDTIIIFDRIRENLEKSMKAKAGKKAHEMRELSLKALMNLSVNETLSRTLITNMTVFMVVVPLWLFGGGAVSDLAFSLTVGSIVGTYSTIFIACPVVLFFQPSAQVKGSSNAKTDAAAEAQA